MRGHLKGASEAGYRGRQFGQVGDDQIRRHPQALHGRAGPVHPGHREAERPGAGDIKRVGPHLGKLAREGQVDEIMIATMGATLQERCSSYRLFAQEFSLQIPHD